VASWAFFCVVMCRPSDLDAAHRAVVKAFQCRSEQKERGLQNLNIAPKQDIWMAGAHLCSGGARSSDAEHTHIDLLPWPFSDGRYPHPARLVSAGVTRCRRSVHSVLHTV